MAGILFANDFGGIGNAMQADEAQRQQAWQYAMSSMADRQRQAQSLQIARAQMQQRDAEQAQDQAYRKLALAQTGAYQNATLAQQNRAFDFSKEYNNKLLEQPTKESQQALKEKGRQLQFVVENRLAYDPQAFADVPPEVRDPLIQLDRTMREKEVQDLQTAQEAVLAARRLKMVDQRAAELEKAAKEAPSRNRLLGVFGGVPGMLSGASETGRMSVTGQPSPEDMAKMLRDRTAPFRTKYAPLLDPKKGYVEVGSGGDLVPHSRLLKAWMTGANTVGAKQNSGDFGGETGAAQPVPMTNQSRALNISPNGTGTNAPAITNPDGSVSTVLSIGVGDNRGEWVIPTIVNGKKLSSQEATRLWKSGKNPALGGPFKTIEESNQFAQKYHENEARRLNLQMGAPPMILPTTGTNAPGFAVPPPPPMTATNRPVMTNQTVRVKMPDGTVLRGPAQNVEAAIALGGVVIGP